MAETQNTPSFPALAHQRLLRQRCENSGSNNKIIGVDPNKLTEPERWQWYAYQHAFFRLTHNRAGYARTDPKGEWFEPELVRLAETQFKKELGQPRHPTPPIDREPSAAERARAYGNHELAWHFDQQDRERAEFIHIAGFDRDPATWRNPDGSPTEAAIDFAALCRRQAEANYQIFADKNAAAFGTPSSSMPTQVWDTLLDNLGVKASEKKD